MNFDVVNGDLLDQQADAIVNAWNRNVISWWLLLPQGVSGAIKRRAGLEPFRQLGRFGPIPLGGAVITGAGRLPYRAIIHVAGIDLLWRASERSIRDSVRSAVQMAERHALPRIALPVVGAGSGGFDENQAYGLIADALGKTSSEVRVTVVRFPRKA